MRKTLTLTFAAAAVAVLSMSAIDDRQASAGQSRTPAEIVLSMRGDGVTSTQPVRLQAAATRLAQIAGQCRWEGNLCVCYHDDFWTPMPGQCAEPSHSQCNSIPGLWSWFVNGNVTFYPDGSLVQGSLTGSWACTEGLVRIVWSHGYTDDLAVSSDGRHMSGQNQNGNHVTGDKIR